jgi:hypothetical protein
MIRIQPLIRWFAHFVGDAQHHTATRKWMTALQVFRRAGVTEFNFHQSSTKGHPMKPVIRYRSQLLFRKSYKPSRGLRIRPAKFSFVFRPVRFGLKPKIETYEAETS